MTSVERSQIIIPTESLLYEIIIGLLLGDGHIARRSLTANSRFVYAQSSAVHSAYFYYVFNLFYPLYFVNNYKLQIRTSMDKRSGITYNALAFTTMQLPCFNIYKEIFYIASLKIVPYNIYELLTPIP